VVLTARFPRLRRLVRRVGALNVAFAAAYVLLILFLLAVSIGYDPDRATWRLGPIEPETIVLALLLFLPLILPRVTSLSFPFFTGQASIQFRELHERIELQEKKVDKLSNETDLLLTSLAANFLAPGSSRKDRRDTIVIGCQRGLEQKVLGALLKKSIQATLGGHDDQVIAWYDYGGGALNFISLYRGKIDVCPAYTWQGYEMSLGPSLQYSADELGRQDIQASISRLNELYASSEIEWLSYLGFASNWEIVLLEEQASALGIDTVHALTQQSSKLVLGCPREFFARDAGFGSLERAGNRFLDVKFVEGSALYDDLFAKRIDVGVGFSTDPMLKSRAVRALTGGQWFGTYQAVPIARKETLESHPEIREAVAALGARLGGPRNDAMSRIRDVVGMAEASGGSDEAIEAIAERFLRSEALLPGGRRG
jgi:glycine betaine/choline ABC-type transport system substrate-binding protein